MSVTALDILRAAREYAADPDHIVLDPHQLYEDDAGNESYPQDGATRGCVIGCKSIVSLGLGVRGTKADTEALNLIVEAIDELHDDCDYLAALGSPETIDAVYAHAISALENA